jgi:hypothetical protein
MEGMPGLLEVLVFGVWIFGIIDAVVTDKAAVRNLPKWAWIALVVLFPPLGALGWFLWGRPTRPFSGVRAGTDPLPPRPAPIRRTRPSRAERAEEEADIRARIAERDRLMAEWAEEDRLKKLRGEDKT